MNEEKEQKVRSNPTNNALHLACEQIASDLNARGIEPEVFLKGIVLTHTKESVKDVYRAIGKHMFGKEHTRLLTQQELNIINEIMTRHLAKFGIEFAFPSIETQMLMQAYEKERI